MARRTELTAAAGTLAAAALLLTACGGSNHDDKIASSPTPSATTAPQTTPPPTTPAADPSAPTFDFPSDVKITIDPDTTGDKTKDAVLRDQAYGLEATYTAVIKQDKNLPQFTTYMYEDADEVWSESIDAFKKNGHTITGTDHYYDRKVTLNGDMAGVTFCEDQSHFYDKEITTGKVLTTTPSANSFILHSSHMKKGTDGIWHTETYTSQAGGAHCRA